MNTACFVYVAALANKALVAQPPLVAVKGDVGNLLARHFAIFDL